MNAEELLKNFQGMLNAYQEEHAAVAVADNTSADMKKLISKARNAKFIKHILYTADQPVRDLYCTGLFSLFQMEKDAGNRNNAMVFVGRIIASYSDNVDLDGYLVKSAKIDTKFWSDFFEFIKDDVAFNFAVDALLMYYLSGRADAMLKGILDVVEVFSVDKKRLFGLVKAILEQDADGVVDFGGKYFLGYALNKRLAYAKYLKRNDDAVVFGKWYEIKYTKNANEDYEREYLDTKKAIEWYVIDVRDDKALILSKFGVEFRSIGCSTRYIRNTNWSNCHLRKWLNNEFLSKAFTSTESLIISGHIVDNEDVVFLLSTSEIRNYLVDTNKLKCDKDIFGGDLLSTVGINTRYGIRHNVNGWWLSSNYEGDFSYVSQNKSINSGECCVFGLVRPAMWVKVDSEIFDV